MARARFTGPPNPDPAGVEQGHTVPLLGRTVRPDELIDIPGGLLEETADAWVMGAPGGEADDGSRYVLPKALWSVESQPAAKAAKGKGE
jgi:hypothetical protein